MPDAKPKKTLLEKKAAAYAAAIEVTRAAVNYAWEHDYRASAHSQQDEAETAEMTAGRAFLKAWEKAQKGKPDAA